MQLSKFIAQLPRKLPGDEVVEDGAPYKAIEIYYDAALIPDGFNHPLDFRNAALALIDKAMTLTGTGEWAGAQSSSNLETGEAAVHFGFEVSDFERAEKLVHETVMDTPFNCIRNISRYEETEETRPKVTAS